MRNEKKLLPVIMFHASRRSMNVVATKYSILEYSYIEGMLEKRGPFRMDHLENIKKFKINGLMTTAGAHADGTSAMFFFTPKATPTDIEAFMAADSYIKNDLVTDHRVRDFMSVDFEQPDI